MYAYTEDVPGLPRCTCTAMRDQECGIHASHTMEALCVSLAHQRSDEGHQPANQDHYHPR